MIQYMIQKRKIVNHIQGGILCGERKRKYQINL